MREKAMWKSPRIIGSCPISDIPEWCILFKFIPVWFQALLWDSNSLGCHNGWHPLGQGNATILIFLELLIALDTINLDSLSAPNWEALFCSGSCPTLKVGFSVVLGSCCSAPWPVEFPKVPSCWKAWGAYIKSQKERAFSVAPRLWNFLPEEIHLSLFCCLSTSGEDFLFHMVICPPS